MKRNLFLTTVITSVCLVLPLGLAQSLAELLPAETFLALGTRGLAEHEAELEPFIQEFERLELGAALMAAFAPADAADTTAAPVNPLSQALGNSVQLEPLDILGQEAWIAVSASAFNPLPALTLVSELSPAAADTFADLIAEDATRETTETLNEGDITFYLQAVTDPESPIQVIAYGQVGNTLVLSTNPDTLRGVLRQLGGSADPGFTDGAGYALSLGELDAANFSGYLDFSQLVNVVSPYARGLGFDKLVKRLVSAFDTAGVTAGVMRFTADGLENEGIQAINPEGGDDALVALLTAPANADNTLALAPASALAISSSATDLAAWWDYLNEISESTPELGGSLDSLLASFTGIDLRASLFSWLGDNITTITTGISEAPEPGVAGSNLLGESVYILSTTDEAAAQAGLGNLLATISGLVSSFADPTGGAGSASQLAETINGVEVNSYNITDGVALSYAVSNGQVFIGTSSDGLSSVLLGEGESLTTAPELQTLLRSFPESASSLAVADNRATLAGTASQIGAQIQMTAGIGGASNLNFEAVEAASSKLEQFLTFVAERLGYSASYTERDGARAYTYGKTTVNW